MPTLGSGLGWVTSTDDNGFYLAVGVVPEPGRALLLFGALVWLILCRRRPLPTPGSDFADGVEHIHRHYGAHLAVLDLAQIAHLSERQLNRRFQKTYRMSTREFIVRTCIQAACDELIGTEKSIADIALEHGFYDQSAFTRQFRQHIGETPLTFRCGRGTQRQG